MMGICQACQPMKMLVFHLSRTRLVAVHRPSIYGGACFARAGNLNHEHWIGVDRTGGVHHCAFMCLRRTLDPDNILIKVFRAICLFQSEKLFCWRQKLSWAVLRISLLSGYFKELSEPRRIKNSVVIGKHFKDVVSLQIKVDIAL